MNNNTMTPKRRFLSGLFGGRVDRIPVGSPTSVATVECMNLCGAYFPEVHLNAEAMASLATTAHTVLGYDCIMPVFSVQQESAALGCEVDWGAIDTMPVSHSAPWEFPDDVSIPAGFLDKPSIRTVLQALRILRKEHGSRVAIVGKVMGPWTLAYHMHGVQDFLIKILLEPHTVRAFLDKLKHVTILFGRAQIDAGADVLCVADHATGDLVRATTYRDFLLPFHQELTQVLGCPTILHICGNTTDRLEYICEAGFDAFHFESKVDAVAARQLTDGRISLVGNINNPESLLQGTPQQVYQEAMAVIRAGVDVVGPECAIPLATPNDNLIAITRAAQDFTAMLNRESGANMKMV
jgi:MtaA/CmuA family methyltransferase